jgi:hypothetical protein
MSEANQQTVISSPRLGLYRELESVRAAQDEKWGGANHDDSHTTLDWAGVIDTLLLRGTVPVPNRRLADVNQEQRCIFRMNMIRVAAVALAAVEGCDRAAQDDGEESLPASQSLNDSIMLRCPHCKEQYEARIGNNPLVKDGLTITPLEPEHFCRTWNQNGFCVECGLLPCDGKPDGFSN